MSQHTVVQGDTKFVFGWDQPLESFFLQVHDTTRPEDEQITARTGSTADTKLPSVQHLVYVAHWAGLEIEYEMQVQLQREQDCGR